MELSSLNFSFKYLLVLSIYAIIYLFIRNKFGTINKEFEKSFWILFLGWALGTFYGNYQFYKWGFMSFLPWTNNFIHTFIWIGICLATLYAGIYKRPISQQIVLFVIFSFIIKMSEYFILGTWELDHFFGIKFPFSYIIGWSIMDGLYPFISIAGLWLASKFIKNIAVPKIKNTKTAYHSGNN